MKGEGVSSVSKRGWRLRGPLIGVVGMCRAKRGIGVGGGIESNLLSSLSISPLYFPLSRTGLGDWSVDTEEFYFSLYDLG